MSTATRAKGRKDPPGKNARIDEQLLEKARLYVRRWFARHMPRTMFFHDLEHTLSVTRSAIALGRSIGLQEDKIALLELAALFHDTGYARTYKGHEAESAAIAEVFLHKQKVAEKDIRLVIDLIMVTALESVPKTTLERIMRDADSAKAGQADFQEKSELLRRELGSILGKRPGGREWLQENIDYLKGHRFHTQQGRKRYDEQKRINLRELEEQVSRNGRPAASPKIHHDRTFDRDLSWLSFNGRVLQEAADPRVPLLERVKFLAIYSNNLDEFYRVRVASLRGLTKLNKAYRNALEIAPAKLVDKINRKALEQQQLFGNLFRNELLPELERNGIRILQPERLNAKQKRFVKSFFNERILPLINTAAARPGNAPFVEDRKLYFACTIKPAKGKQGKSRTFLINIPSVELGRFVILPSAPDATDIMFLDDAVRMGLPGIFKGHRITGCHAIKLSRDAELYLDEEFTGNVKDKVKKSLKKRHTGVPSRFLYEHNMPKSTLRSLRQLLGLKKQDVVPGGRYHNFNDLMHLPVKGHQDLRDEEQPGLLHPAFPLDARMLKAIARKDVLLHFPYHDFWMLIRLLQQAATDPAVTHIRITLYRVAEGSAVCATLVDALHNGKQVTVFVEVQARFDEGSNLFWGEALERAGADVLYSYENLKVHCKLCSIERKEGNALVRYAYLGTGNFNERTSRIYSDFGLLTRDPGINREVAEVFAHLKDRSHVPHLDKLWMAPLTLRGRFEEMIDAEIMRARSGKEASLSLKLNSLEDGAMIQKLYDASRAGVKIRIMVRGICCLIPGIPDMSENIEVRSIVDRYLEHARIYVFHNDGAPMVLLASADLMTRNLDRRIEVAFPILDVDIRKEVLHLLDLQWQDCVKAREIDAAQINRYVPPPPGKDPVQAQKGTYAYYRSRATEKPGRKSARKKLA